MDVKLWTVFKCGKNMFSDQWFRLFGPFICEILGPYPLASAGYPNGSLISITNSGPQLYAMLGLNENRKNSIPPLHMCLIFFFPQRKLSLFWLCIDFILILNRLWRLGWRKLVGLRDSMSSLSKKQMQRYSPLVRTDWGYEIWIPILYFVFSLYFKCDVCS